MSDEIANLFARKYIARTDVKAVQHADGSWAPHTVDGRKDSERVGWNRADLNAHIAGTQTFGHYLLNERDECKLFAFDIDFEKNKPPKGDFPGWSGSWPDLDGNVHQFDARAAWRDRAHPSRDWGKYQLKMVATRLLRTITEDLGIPGAVAYSGHKGVHVYGFTGLVPAQDAMDGARLVFDMMGGWTPSRGTNFYRSDNQDPNSGFPNLTIEVFPKQASISSGGGYGNLMRLPLGKHKMTDDPTFFIDMTSPMGVLKPVDPVWALTTDSPWKRPDE